MISTIASLFSEDRRYRYILMRDLGQPEEATSRIQFIMLNPSTADEVTDDRTVAKITRWSVARGYRALWITNLSPLRATNPQHMKVFGPEPQDIWDENINIITCAAQRVDQIVLAWGTSGAWENRDKRICQALANLDLPPEKFWSFGLTKDGHPKHPLYLPDSLELQPFTLPTGDKHDN